MLYANGCGTIRKPLIIAEGLDTGLLGNDVFGDNDIGDFLRGVDDSNSQDLINLISTTNTGITDDFDLIYVNWDNGVDDLRRNALVLEAAIKWVNAQKAGTEQNVVLGQSMGGVIARYALRNMEKKGQDHDTALYISHDAPHQGAHVPVGGLAMVRHALNDIITTPIGDVAVDIASGVFPVAQARQLIEQPAVRQLLVNYVDRNYRLDNSEHREWMTALRNMGYPQRTRNLAISNGSHCGNGYGIASDQVLFNASASGGTGIVSDVILTFLPILGTLPGLALGDVQAGLLGFLPGNASISSSFRVNAFSNVANRRLYHGRITYRKKLLWLVPITRTITERTFGGNAEQVILDNVPGGDNPLFSNLNLETASGNNVLFNYGLDVDIVPDLSFIPSVSALDVGTNGTRAPDDYFKVYTVNGTNGLSVPFDNFTTTFNGNGDNEPHISFNRPSGNWLAAELRNLGRDFDCSFVCESQEIIGQSTLCSRDTYTVDIFGDAQVFWSSSEPGVVTPTSPNSPTTSFTTPANSYRRPVTLRARISSNICGFSRTITKEVYIGRPGTPSRLTGPTTVVTGGLVTYQGGRAEGATSYEWRLPYPFDRVSNFDLFGQNWQIYSSSTSYQSAQVFTGYSKQSGLIQLMGRNRCGLGGARTLSVRHATNGGGGGEGGIPVRTRLGDAPPETVTDASDGVKLYPNPADERVEMSLISGHQIDPDRPSRILSAAIYGQGSTAPVLEREYGLKGVERANMNVGNLVPGFYVMVLRTDKGEVYKKLLIER